MIRAFDVLGYSLYPGNDGTGLAHDLPRGVSIIAGINGIGKTTLLNALLRLLIGPWDVLREDPDDIGSTRHELVQWRTPNYFAGRVPDRAASATVGGWITFGERKLYVRRSLANLFVIELALDDKPLPPSDENYRAVAQKLSGVQDFYDYHFVVRNLLFYLEDRRPLIWADEGQFEIARALFVLGPDTTQISRQYDAIKQVDSRYRNLLTEHNRNIKRLRELRRATSMANDAAARIAAVQESFEGTAERLSRVDASLDACITEEREVSDASRRQQIDVEGSLRDYESYQQAFFRNAFPSSEETFQYVLAHIVAGGGCLVCGSDAREEETRLRHRIAGGHCPVCDSPPESQEKLVAAAEVAAERVNKAERELDIKREALTALEGTRGRLSGKMAGLLDERRELQTEIDEIQVELNALKARLPARAGEISELEASVKVGQARIDELAKGRSEAIKLYRELMLSAGSAIKAVQGEIKRNFQDCAKAFLEERCELNYRERDRQVGQSGERVRFPGFDVMMTSGTFPDSPTPRRSQEDVSESQKEFIDLAFRIALIKTASADRGAMIVLETPEASLDSLFTYRAGDLLRSFSEDGGEVGNVLLASSNLNDANMIPALLGIDKYELTPSDVPSRMVNLLKEAAENAALVKERERYDQRYVTATESKPSRLPR